MRVISGKYRGAKLIPPIDDRVRPTTDRIKESVFNIVSSKVGVANAAVLDLFAGSGALGIEALSRDAAKAVFIDKDKDSIQIVNANLAKLKIPTKNYGVYNVDYEFALKKLSGQLFDIIFVDPPYALRIEHKILDLILKYDILAENGLVVVEHDTNNDVSHEKFTSDCRVMGNTSVSFMSRSLL